jgi:hypothetical protein
MSQTYPRYGARDFERRWQTRLNTPPRQTTNNASQLHVESDAFASRHQTGSVGNSGPWLAFPWKSPSEARLSSIQRWVLSARVKHQIKIIM